LCGRLVVPVSLLIAPSWRARLNGVDTYTAPPSAVRSTHPLPPTSPGVVNTRFGSWVWTSLERLSLLQWPSPIRCCGHPLQWWPAKLPWQLLPHSEWRMLIPKELPRTSQVCIFSSLGVYGLPMCLLLIPSSLLCANCVVPVAPSINTLPRAPPFPTLSTPTHLFPLVHLTVQCESSSCEFHDILLFQRLFTGGS
jgi:hypothetical protein